MPDFTSGADELVVTLARPRSYDDPIRVAGGTAVSIERRDSEWAGWVWCVSPAGKAGWVPESLVEIDGQRGRIMADYDAIELSVAAGERLQGFQRVNGWVWCRNAAGQCGWVPLANVTPPEGT